ncbi:hypothetical protein [Bradyrhizobium sp. URHD0069]|uniref:hypothetical protein n=1 Tax=Bradyrhizobium sp. URHD0069 TaxID=1380355 RepID=UPI0012DDB89D|nr:hypothetical protein [Bradyrhizobium sp. URHD0069]
MWRGKSLAATALTFAVLGSIGGACSLWPSLDDKLRRDFELMVLGRDSKATEAVGRADCICFNQTNHQLAYRSEFLSESKRLGDVFTQSLEGCGIENSCCGAGSHFSGAIGLVKSGKIRCIEIDGFDFYLKLNRPFCAKPERLVVSSKISVPGERPLGRQWVARAGRTSFEVWEKTGE